MERKKNFYLFLLSVCACMCTCVCYGIHAQVRGQFRIQFALLSDESQGWHTSGHWALQRGLLSFLIDPQAKGCLAHCNGDVNLQSLWEYHESADSMVRLPRAPPTESCSPLPCPLQKANPPFSKAPSSPRMPLQCLLLSQIKTDAHLLGLVSQLCLQRRPH